MEHPPRAEQNFSIYPSLQLHSYMSVTECVSYEYYFARDDSPRVERMKTVKLPEPIHFGSACGQAFNTKTPDAEYFQQLNSYFIETRKGRQHYSFWWCLWTDMNTFQI